MKKLLALFVLMASGLAYGQYTNITAQIKDANQIPYANGKVSVTLPQGEVFSGTGLQPPNSGSAQLDATGSFSLRLASNSGLSPSGSQWTFNICNAAGTTCFTSAQTVTGTTQNLSTALSAAAATLPVPTDFVREFLLQAAPANPPAGYILLYGDSGTGNLTCLTSAGAACILGGGGGSAPTIQVNGVNTANQTTINFLDSAATNGLTLGFTNPSVGQVKLALTGTLANTGLANSSVTVSTTAPLGGGGSLSLGGSLTLTCTTCLTTSSTLANLASSTSAQLAALLTNETGTGVSVFNDSPTFTTQITSPIVVVGSSNPADSGAIRLDNAQTIAWEANPTGTDATLGVDTSNILQSSVAFNATVLTEGGSGVPNATDNLSFFASTTSAQLRGVLSDETGVGTAVFNDTPALTTPKIQSYTVATLPAAATLSRMAIVTDGVDKADCTSGGGTAKVLCIDNGSAWTSVSGAGAAGANVALSNLAGVAINASLIAASDNAIDLGSNAIKWRTGYFGTSVSTPSVATSGANGGFDGLEGTGAGLTAATSHDLLYPDSTAHRWKVNNNNGGADTLAVFTDTLAVFAATTSAQLRGVLSDETGTGVAVFATAPTFTTSITTPVLISGAADPADAGAIRLGNAENIAWENATPGTDLTLTMNASNVLAASTPISATTGFQIGGAATSNHCMLGNGTNYVDSTGCGLTSSGLNQFASTTSAQLAGVLSDETGSGLAVFATSPALVNPVETMSSIGTSTATGLRLTGSSLTAGNAYYMQSGGTLASANATTSSTMPGLCVADSTTTCVYSGIYRFSATQSWTVGGKIYISTSAGALTQTAPSTSGNVVQCLGVALANDTILVRACDTGTIQ